MALALIFSVVVSLMTLPSAAHAESACVREFEDSLRIRNELLNLIQCSGANDKDCATRIGSSGAGAAVAAALAVYAGRAGPADSWIWDCLNGRQSARGCNFSFFEWKNEIDRIGRELVYSKQELVERQKAILVESQLDPKVLEKFKQIQPSEFDIRRVHRKSVGQMLKWLNDPAIKKSFKSPEAHGKVIESVRNWSETIASSTDLVPDVMFWWERIFFQIPEPERIPLDIRKGLGAPWTVAQIENSQSGLEAAAQKAIKAAHENYDELLTYDNQLNVGDQKSLRRLGLSTQQINDITELEMARRRLNYLGAHLNSIGNELSDEMRSSRGLHVPQTVLDRIGTKFPLPFDLTKLVHPAYWAAGGGMLGKSLRAGNAMIQGAQGLLQNHRSLAVVLRGLGIAAAAVGSTGVALAFQTNEAHCGGELKAQMSRFPSFCSGGAIQTSGGLSADFIDFLTLPDDEFKSVLSEDTLACQVLRQTGKQLAPSSTWQLLCVDQGAELIGRSGGNSEGQKVQIIRKQDSAEGAPSRVLRWSSKDRKVCAEKNLDATSFDFVLTSKMSDDTCDAMRVLGLASKAPASSEEVKAASLLSEWVDSNPLILASASECCGSSSVASQSFCTALRSQDGRLPHTRIEQRSKGSHRAQ